MTPLFVMARFMRAIQFLPDPKLDGPDKPGHDGCFWKVRTHA
jgi:hypothetical protein